MIAQVNAAVYGQQRSLVASELILLLQGLRRRKVEAWQHEGSQTHTVSHLSDGTFRTR